MFKKIFKENIVFFAILGVYLLLFVIYVAVDNTPPHWDSGRHLYNTLNYWTYFKNIFVTNKINGQTDAISNFFTGYFYYPPGVYWISLPFLILFGRNYDGALISNLLWIVLICFSVKNWLDLVGISKYARNIALMFLLGLPFIIGQSREYQLDFPAISTIFLVLYTTENILKKLNYRNILLFSFSVALALIVKWSALVYLPLLLAFYAIRQIIQILINKNYLNDFKKLVALGCTAVIFVTAIAGIWYIPSLTRLKLDLTQNSGTAGIAEGDPQGFTVESFKFYLSVLINTYFWLGWLLFILALLIIGSALVTTKKSNFKFVNSALIFNLCYTIINLIIMYGYHMKQSNKDARYIIILIPSFVFLVAFLAEIIHQSKLSIFYKHIFTFVAGVLFVFNLANLTLPLGDYSIIIRDTLVPITVIGNSGYTNTRLKHKDWAIYKALEAANSQKQEYVQSYSNCLSANYWKSKPTVGIDFDSMPLHTNFGTVWGIAEQYGLELGSNESSCFIIVAQMKDKEKINVDKYLNNYTEIDRYVDWQGFNMVLLKKKI